MSDFNDELYTQRKEYWMEEFRKALATVDGNSTEDVDAFFNALEDFCDEDVPGG